MSDEVRDIINGLHTNNSPLLQRFQAELQLCYSKAATSHPKEYVQLFPLYPVIKKKLIKQFGVEVYEEHKAVVSRTLQIIVEKNPATFP